MDYFSLLVLHIVCSFSNIHIWTFDWISVCSLRGNPIKSYEGIEKGDVKERARGSLAPTRSTYL